MRENWLPVVGFEHQYEVSDCGNVRSCVRALPFKAQNGTWHLRKTEARLLSLQLINSGYLVVHLHHKNKRTVRTVHSLVAAAFIGPRPKNFDVAHADGFRLNNRRTNLRYLTRVENHAEKRIHGTHAQGSQIRQAKLKEVYIPSIRGLQGVKTAAEVGVMFGVQYRAIERIWEGKSWRHV